MQCPHCNQEHPEGTLFCPLTGKGTLLTSCCPQCASSVEAGWSYCPVCGHTLKAVGGGDLPASQIAGEPQASLKLPGSPTSRTRARKLSWQKVTWVTGGLLLVASIVFLFLWKSGQERGTPLSLGILPTATRHLTATIQPAEHIVDLVARELITYTVTGAGIDSLALKVQSNVNTVLKMDIPAGTYFVADNPLSQNMVVRHSFTTLIQPIGEVDINLDVACANLRRNEPTAQDTFTIQRIPMPPDLISVLDRLNAAGVAYAIEQAAIWIITDDATFDELGMLVGGSRLGEPLINESETVHAMMLISEAGINIQERAIWKDGPQLYSAVVEPDLQAWLSSQGLKASFHLIPLEEDEEKQIDEPSGKYYIPDTFQFASQATASSQFSENRSSAMQAVGINDFTDCSDSASAWSSLEPDGKDWLLLTYDTPVIPTHIDIYQGGHPGAITRVEVIDESGNAILVYEATPEIISEGCDVLMIEIQNVNVMVRSIRITVDQSRHNGYNQIEAVELWGVAEHD